MRKIKIKRRKRMYLINITFFFVCLFVYLFSDMYLVNDDDGAISESSAIS